MKTETKETMMITSWFLAAIAAIFAIWILCCFFEAQAFNRVTGRNVTVWDAMWLQLRVDDD